MYRETPLICTDAMILSESLGKSQSQSESRCTAMSDAENMPVDTMSVEKSDPCIRLIDSEFSCGAHAHKCVNGAAARSKRAFDAPWVRAWADPMPRRQTRQVAANKGFFELPSSTIGAWGRFWRGIQPHHEG